MMESIQNGEEKVKDIINNIINNNKIHKRAKIRFVMDIRDALIDIMDDLLNTLIDKK